MTDELVSRVLHELRGEADVYAASASTSLPYESVRLFGGGFGATHTIEAARPGEAFRPREPRRRTVALYVTPEFARTAGLRIVRGRFLTADDEVSSQRPIVVDEAFAQLVFGGVDVVGRAVTLRHDDVRAAAPTVTVAMVVGVVEVLGRAIDDSLVRPEVIYAPFNHRPAPDRQIASHWRVVVMARARGGDATALTGVLRTALRRVDQDVAIAQAGRVDRLAAGPVMLLEFFSLAFGFLAALALALSMAGLYGVLSHVVERRTRELAIRVALGAERWRVARLILRQGFRPIAEGLFIGLGAAFVIRQYVQQSMTATLSPLDTATFALAAVPLIAAGVTACYLPARRASTVNPTDALRHT